MTRGGLRRGRLGSRRRSEQVGWHSARVAAREGQRQVLLRNGRRDGSALAGGSVSGRTGRGRRHWRDRLTASRRRGVQRLSGHRHRVTRDAPQPSVDMTEQVTSGCCSLTWSGYDCTIGHCATTRFPCVLTWLTSLTETNRRVVGPRIRDTELSAPTPRQIQQHALGDVMMLSWIGSGYARVREERVEGSNVGCDVTMSVCAAVCVVGVGRLRRAE